MDAIVKKPRSCITDLSNDSLSLIIERLGSKCDRDSFGLACHHFLDIQNTSRKSLELNFFPWSRISPRPIVVTDSPVLEKMFKRFRNIESLCLRSCDDIPYPTLTQLQKNWSKLQCLYLDFCSDATDVGLISIASLCPFLSAISLWSCYSVSDGGLEILTKSCKSLKEVYLGGCENITDKGILSINQNCRQLRTLHISWCQKIVGVGLKGISPTLTCLELKSYGWDPVLSRVFSEGSLKYLSICISVPYDSYLRQAEIDLGFASNLKILDFRNCKRAVDNTIKKISMGCPMLKEWNLSFCDNVRLPGWEWIGLYCQSLERLHVHNCRNFCDQGLLALGNGCRLLSVIYMSDCRQITPSGIQAFKKQREDVEISDIQLTTIAPSWAFTFKGQENQLKLKD